MSDALLAHAHLPASSVVVCPRCHATCGWCGDFRWMHGLYSLPGSGRRYCTLTEVSPEGDGCPVCKGARHVLQMISYAAIPAPGTALPSNNTGEG